MAGHQYEEQEITQFNQFVISCLGPETFHRSGSGFRVPQTVFLYAGRRIKICLPSHFVRKTTSSLGNDLTHIPYKARACQFARRRQELGKTVRTSKILLKQRIGRKSIKVLLTNKNGNCDENYKPAERAMQPELESRIEASQEYNFQFIFVEEAWSREVLWLPLQPDCRCGVRTAGSSGSLHGM